MRVQVVLCASKGVAGSRRESGRYRLSSGGLCGRLSRLGSGSLGCRLSRSGGGTLGRGLSWWLGGRLSGLGGRSLSGRLGRSCGWPGGRGSGWCSGRSLSVWRGPSRIPARLLPRERKEKKERRNTYESPVSLDTPGELLENTLLAIS